MAAILSRLLLVLAVALFGAHQVGAERTATPGSPVAAVEGAFAPAILTAQNHLVRALLPEGDTPQTTLLTPEFPTPPQTLVRVSWEPETSGTAPSISILPHVRGPPAI